MTRYVDKVPWSSIFACSEPGAERSEGGTTVHTCPAAAILPPPPPLYEKAPVTASASSFSCPPPHPCPRRQRHERVHREALHGPGLWIFQQEGTVGILGQGRRRKGLLTPVRTTVPPYHRTVPSYGRLATKLPSYLGHLGHLEPVSHGGLACYLRSLRSKTQRARQGAN